jgi:hypothetical protein
MGDGIECGNVGAALGDGKCGQAMPAGLQRGRQADAQLRGMGLRRGPAGLRQGFVIGEARAVEVLQALARVIGADHEDGSVMPRRAALDPVVGRSDIGHAIKQPGAERVAAGLRQKKVGRLPGVPIGVLATGQRLGGRNPALAQAVAEQRPKPVIRALRRAEVIHAKAGDHARSAFCRAKRRIHIGQAQKVRDQPHQPVLLRLAQPIGQRDRPERDHQLGPVFQRRRHPSARG